MAGLYLGCFPEPGSSGELICPQGSTWGEGGCGWGSARGCGGFDCRMGSLGSCPWVVAVPLVGAFCSEVLIVAGSAGSRAFLGVPSDDSVPGIVLGECFLISFEDVDSFPCSFAGEVLFNHVCWGFPCWVPAWVRV